MSIHAKFNPEGVKGRIAQPPHKIFNFMQYGYFDVTVSVKDAVTMIELYEVKEFGIKARCENIAIRKVMQAATDFIRSQWRFKLYDKLCLGPYKLTAKQLWGLVDAGYIKQPNDKVIEVKSVILDGRVD